jgi:hypothetical protein
VLSFSPGENIPRSNSAKSFGLSQQQEQVLEDEEGICGMELKIGMEDNTARVFLNGRRSARISLTTVSLIPCAGNRQSAGCQKPTQGILCGPEEGRARGCPVSTTSVIPPPLAWSSQVSSFNIMKELKDHKNFMMTMRYAHHYPESLRHGVDILDGFGQKNAQSGHTLDTLGKKERATETVTL